MTVFWASVAGLAAIVPEYLYRATSARWLALAPVVVPCSLVVSYAVCRLVRSTESLPDAFIFFALVTTGLRLALSVFVLGDRIAPGTWAGLTLVVAARAAQAWWR